MCGEERGTEEKRKQWSLEEKKGGVIKLQA